MEYLPLFLDVRGRDCALVGGDATAARKAELLLRAGAQVRVLAPALDPALARWAREGRVSHRSGPLDASFFAHCCLAIVAVEDEPLARAAAQLAQAQGIPVNTVDRPQLCTFIMPAIVDRSPVLVAISTAGAAPVLGRLLRARLEALLPARLGRLAQLARTLRPQVAARVPAARRRAFWEAVLQGPIAESVFAGRELQAREAMLARLDDGADAAAGEAYLVALPPQGDPEQLTLRALRLLQQADVMFVDDGLPQPVGDLIRRDAERRVAEADPARVIAQIATLAQAGRRVGWLVAAHGDARQRLQQLGVSVLLA